MREDRKKREPPFTSRTAVGTFSPNAMDSKRNLSYIPKAGILKVLQYRAQGRWSGHRAKLGSDALSLGQGECSPQPSLSLAGIPSYCRERLLRSGVGSQVRGREQSSTAGGEGRGPNPR